MVQFFEILNKVPKVPSTKVADQQSPSRRPFCKDAYTMYTNTRSCPLTFQKGPNHSVGDIISFQVVFKI